MRVRFGSVAALALSFLACAVQAQTVSQIGGPKELPPAGFDGMQYIDSRGCVFLRAGMGNGVNWVARVGQNRKVLCGYPPTFGAKGTAQVAAQSAQPAPRMAEAEVPQTEYVPPPATTGKLIPTPTPSMARPMAPAVPAAVPSATLPRASAPLVIAVAPGASVEAAQGGVSCPASAPRLERLPLTNGGTVLVCTPGDGTPGGLRAPVFAGTPRVGAAFDDAATPAPLGQASAKGQRLTARLAPDQPVSDLRVASQGIDPPPGYTAAWSDDRLNPLRGVGTAAGQAMQDQVWTRTVPLQLVGDTPRARHLAAQERTGTAYVTVSTKSPSAERPVPSYTPSPALRSPATPASAQGWFVQVGSFAVPGNAEGTAARLRSAGLPVARSRVRGLDVVLAGPFPSQDQAAGALRLVRMGGFADAFLR